MQPATRESVMQLLNAKVKLEEDIKSLFEVLQSNNVDMDQPLVDSEGFPRSDIDVYQVRHARHQIICLRNDLKEVMAKIEQGLHSLHSQQREGLGENVTSEDFSSYKPFAKVEAVVEGSPAAFAGLQTGDRIVGFGTLRFTNFRAMQDVATLVQHSVNRSIPVHVSRNKRIIPLSLTPKTWSGRGLLGCMLLPIDNIDR